MAILKYIIWGWVLCFPVVQAESISVPSETGDILMIHHLRNGEIWGSLMITDQVPDDFSDSELIVLQIDQNKPIKLDMEKRCNTPAGTDQKVDYQFEIEGEGRQWLFNKTVSVKQGTDFLKLAGWDSEHYDHMKSDRRPNVVDFPILAELAMDSLWQQFTHGREVLFHYTTDAGEPRSTRFMIKPYQTEIRALLTSD